jgi:hypothetical protein
MDEISSDYLPLVSSNFSNEMLKIPKGQSEVIHWSISQYNSQQKKGKRQTMFHKTLHRKLKIEQHDPH